ncbi:hypothetical protein MNBD_BACTEROID03-2551 [hydrothermal vent metagenome]|uniref:Beta-galactosidase n=1 Tax=hydrothermal vent metagenome TaxID=652676 RepID=A0A3B0T9Q3_9ZZZZ
MKFTINIHVDYQPLTEMRVHRSYLQGVAFSNFIWSDTPFPEVHHSEVDYQRTKDMGMNVIRFYMNYSYFEDGTNPYTNNQGGIGSMRTLLGPKNIIFT